MCQRIIIILKILILIFKFCESSQISQVYSPLYLNKFDTLNDSFLPLQIKIAHQANLVFISYGFGGIRVLDERGQNVIFSSDINSSYVEAIDVSSDGRYLLIGIHSQVAVFEIEVDYFLNINNKMISNDIIMRQVSVIQFPTDINIIIYNEFYEIAIVAGRDGFVIIYDIQDKNQLVSLQEYNTGSYSINNIKISLDSTWIYIASDIKGVIILKLIVNQVQGKKSVDLVLAANGIGGIRSFDVAATSDNQFIYAIDFWYGFYIAKTVGNQMNEQDQYPINLVFFEFWPFKQISPTCQKIIMSKDNNYIFLGVRSQGIIIFDNNDRDNVKFFQQIKVNSLAQSINLSEKEDYLYFSNSASVFIFQRTTPFLNDKNPHLFNSHQAQQKEFYGRFKWRCKIDKNNQHLFFSFDVDGTYAFKFYNNPYQLNVKSSVSFDLLTDSVDIDLEEKYMFVPQYFDKNLLLVYQISPINDSVEEQNISLYNPKFLYSFSVNQVQITEMIKFSYDQKYAVQAYATGLILYDVQNIFDIKVLFYWKNSQFMVGENQGVAMTKDNKWIISTIRLFGVYVLNAEDKRNLFLTDYIITRGGESIWLSDIYTDYAYLIDGIQGFAIIDLKKLPKIVILSRVALPGWSVMSILLQNDNFILVSQMEDGMLTLLDIKDKSNPSIASTFRYAKQFGGGICMPKSAEYLFIGSPQGIITLPLSSNAKIHTDINEVFVNQVTGKETTQLIIVNDDIKSGKDYFTFKVGQKIQFSFTIIQPEDNDMAITQAYRYIHQKVMDLPSYMSYDLFSQCLTMNVDKDALGSEREKPNKNTILIKIVIPLNKLSFLYSKLHEDDLAITNLSQSSLVLEYLQDINLLDSKRMVTFNFDSQRNIKFTQEFQTLFLSNCDIDFSIIPYDEYLEQVTNKIMVTMIKSYYMNPITFNVQSTLFLNFNTTSSYISSFSQENISIKISIPKDKGKFVPNYFPSVISSLSELQDEIQLEGSLSNINRALESNILFSNSTEFPTNQNSDISYNVTITVADSLNYPIVISQPIQNCNFIKLKKPLQQNDLQRLQSQIENQYPDGILFIETEVLLQFTQDTFLNFESKEVKYKLQYSKTGSIHNDIEQADYKDIEANFWMQSQADDRLAFKGTIKSQYFGSVYFFKVTADNGYTQANDYFYVQLKGVSFIYVVNIMIQILGPLVAILGIYGKRTFLYNMINKHKVMYTEEIVQSDSLFHKKIVILGRIYNDSNILVNQLFAQMTKISQSNQTNSALFKDLEQLNNLEIHPDFKNEEESNRIELDQYLQNVIKKQYNHKLKDLIVKTLPHERKSYLEIRYLNEKGQILIGQIVKDIISLNLSNQIAQKLKWQNDYQSDIANPNSRIFQGIKSISARQLLIKDKKSYLVYQYIKYFSIYNLGNQPNDWYKGVLNIYSTNSNNNNKNNQKNIHNTSIIHHINNNNNNINNLNNQSGINKNNGIQIYPSLELKCDVINNILNHLVSKENQQQDQHKQNELNLTEINMYLIREVIFADAYGFSLQPPTYFFPSRGESIHMHSYEIKSIAAFKKKKCSKWTLPIYRFFNLEYAQYGLYKNMKLPKWLDLDLKYGLITFSGIPQSEDVDEVLIRIYDITQYVIMQFKLIVQPNSIQQIDEQIQFLSQKEILQMNKKQSQNKLEQSKSTNESQQQSPLQLISRQNTIFNRSSQYKSQQSPYSKQNPLNSNYYNENCQFENNMEEVNSNNIEQNQINLQQSLSGYQYMAKSNSKNIQKFPFDDESSNINNKDIQTSVFFTTNKYDDELKQFQIQTLQTDNIKEEI